MKQNSAIDFCRHCPESHHGVCPSILKILTQNKSHFPRQFSLAPGQYLYQQGEHHHGFCLLREGWILLTSITEQGKRQIIRSVLPGDLLGVQPDLH
jgi:CRP-like cAMP-binding protein